ncbi:MAG: hypothetical protein BM557_05680 [Flavobacterium sp. MedPE-SWcel]|uniref:hypothetical protein n=1 Tax=uncultured Flavobacterium sp. TaxID=165435 RepID=UPI0009228CC5|nr:hypothetical protein [uncultured Flavobacterium sp.]OIQ20158.1 MAG: hypothetical protein BM557_05680 [Flavobacterium sp. MedPE-SWcel]
MRVFIACSSDDDSGSTEPQSIVGAWQVVSFVSDAEKQIELNEQCLDKYFITENTAKFFRIPTN